MNMESHSGMILAGKPKKLGESMPQYHFVHNKSHMV
jgi:hypothetical protein